jgi:hypothetical protein
MCPFNEESFMSRKDQGEGDRESARRFNEAEHKFVRSGRVTEAARRAAPRDQREADQMQQAEEAGRSRALDEDPTVPGANATDEEPPAPEVLTKPAPPLGSGLRPDPSIQCRGQVEDLTPKERARPSGRAFVREGDVGQWKKKYRIKSTRTGTPSSQATR